MRNGEYLSVKMKHDRIVAVVVFIEILMELSGINCCLEICLLSTLISKWFFGFDFDFFFVVFSCNFIAADTTDLTAAFCLPRISLYPFTISFICFNRSLDSCFFSFLSSRNIYRSSSFIRSSFFTVFVSFFLQVIFIC